MQSLVGNARFFISLFSLIAFSAGASAQDFAVRSEAEFTLLGPRIESGLRWVVERNRDEALCALTQDEIRRRLRKSSSAVVAAAFEVLREAKVRCEARKLGIEQDYYGFHVSAGVGGSFGLDANTETNNIGSNGVYDPVDAARRAGLNGSGVIGSIGIGYDWKVSNLFSPFKLGNGRGFVGVNVDVTFGGASKTINGIPGIVPFVPAGVATMDTLRFRNDVSVDLTARIGTYVSPSTSIYGLGGLALSSISLKYDCPASGFCGFGGATPAFTSETTKWTAGAVFGVGAETKVAEWLGARGVTQSIDAAAMSLYIEYRAHMMQPVDINAGTLDTRSTSQKVDPSFQTVIVGGRIKF